MKKIVYTLLLLTIGFGCSESNQNVQSADSLQTQEENMGENKAMAGDPKDTAIYALALDTAKDYTERYQAYINSVEMTYPTSKSFTIRASNLLQALGLPVNTPTTYSYVRAYMGMDKEHKYRLMFTPVDSADLDKDEPGKDVILNGNYKNGSASSPGSTFEGRYLLDFTTPCPNSCPPPSGL